MNIEERKQKALALRRQGYNCSQCVMLACADLADLQHINTTDLARLSACFGGGFSASGQMCGVLAAQGMIEGALAWHQPADKPSTYSIVRGYRNNFINRYGTDQCTALKQKGIDCATLITDGIETIVNNHK